MEPITRQEQLLDSIATGNSVELEPITREEMYLSAIAGSTDLIPEKPITRKEMFYEKILESGGVGGDGTAKPTQTKTIKVVENGTYKVTPDSGKVLSSVTANVNVPERYEEGFAEGKEEGYNEGYNKGLADNEPVLEALTATENKEYTPSDNVDGFSSVTVNVPLKYNEGFQAGVDSVKLQEKTVTENGDILPDSGFSGMSKVTVAVPTGSSKEEQEKSITITKNGTTEVTPDEGKTLSKVTVETNVPTGDSGEVGKPYIDTSKMVDFSNFIRNNPSLIEDLDKLDISNGTNFSGMFENCTTLTTIPQFDTSKGENFYNMFKGCIQIKTLLLDISNGTNFSGMCNSCYSLRTVSLTVPKNDLSSNTFNGCSSLINITIGEGWAVSFYLTYSNYLSVESLHGMIENLADLTGKTAKIFQVGATNLAKIDEEHIAMLNAKNWNYS